MKYSVDVRDTSKLSQVMQTRESQACGKLSTKQSPRGAPRFSHFMVRHF